MIYEYNEIADVLNKGGVFILIEEENGTKIYTFIKEISKIKLDEKYNLLVFRDNNYVIANHYQLNVDKSYVSTVFIENKDIKRENKEIYLENWKK